jgi:hypothetical protein
MKQTAITLFLLGATGSAYGYWGAFTQSGHRYYDEMDGYYPFFVLVGSCLLLLTSAILTFVFLVRKK